ncbi:NUDIX hydrolase [candidate division GN15 bacterium]|uniref:NUDIX hydrolase n=1 Tax=candidate division GN15 bacterium TaxID=2072418 RepID=A0A855X3Q9_9BACT|nr:MAG: NUDIX hydrolase [candidate division GN15 bacterium]
MSDKYERFDEQKLFARKAHHCGYTFCPLCGKPLEEALLDGHRRLRCPDESCGFVFYQNPIPAAGAIIVQDDSILLVKRAHPPRIGWWCIPAGFMEWSEHPEQTAVREVREETGLDIKLKSFFEVYTGVDDPRSNAVLLLYLADIVGGTLQASDDALEVQFFPFDALPGQIAFESHRRACADYTRRYRQMRSEV